MACVCSKQSGRRSVVCVCRLRLCWIISDVDTFSVEFYLGIPGVFVFCYAFESRCVVALFSAIGMIFGMSGGTKVVPFVIIGFAVDVINFVCGVRAGHCKPCQSMRIIALISDGNETISSF